MNEDVGVNGLFYMLLLVLPVMALVARRVPLARVALQLAIWAAIFGSALLVVRERDRFDPYVKHAAAWLHLDDQTVVGKEVRIRMARDGHFWATVSLDGVKRRMLVDSGATVTALSVDTAERAGLDVRQPAFPMILRTANGAISAKVATVDEVKLGDVLARRLSVVVSPAFGDTDVLGMNFLSKLKSWRVERDTLILTPNHPQSFT